MIFGLARREFFKILFMLVSLPSRSRPLFSGGEKLPLIYRDIFSSFPSGEVGKFFDTGLVAGGMPLDMKRGRHCEKYRPSFGTFCPKAKDDPPIVGKLVENALCACYNYVDNLHGRAHYE